jgi:hypothetical protein
VGSCAALLKDWRPNCGIHQSTLRQAAKIWLFCYLILVKLFIIACVRFWKYVFVLYILGTSHSHKKRLLPSTCPSRRMYQRRSCSTDFRQIGYREIPDFKIWLKSDTLHESRSPLFSYLLATLNRHKRTLFE